MRVLILQSAVLGRIAAVVLTLVLALGGAWGGIAWAEDTGEEPATAGTEEEEQSTIDDEESEAAEEDAAVEEQATEGEPQGEEGEEALPEGVRRRRPRTAEQERLYKQRKTREDPFLNQPPAGMLDGVYNPARWLRVEVQPGFSRYMVQNEGGIVVGYTTLAIERESDPVLGDFILLKRYDDFEPPRQLDLWLYAETLKPRTKEAVRQLPGAEPLAPGAAGGDEAGAVEVVPLYRDAQRLSADYVFDRVTITHRAGGITASRTIRELPYSYDIDEIPLLVRQLKYNEISWPFEASICDPAHEVNVAVSVGEPAHVASVLSAEPETYRCFELAARVGDEQHTYWVERSPPHKLVKFTDGVYTYTLMVHWEQP